MRGLAHGSDPSDPIPPDPHSADTEKTLLQCRKEILQNGLEYSGSNSGKRKSLSYRKAAQSPSPSIWINKPLLTSTFRLVPSGCCYNVPLKTRNHVDKRVHPLYVYMW